MSHEHDDRADDGRQDRTPAAGKPAVAALDRPGGMDGAAGRVPQCHFPVWLGAGLLGGLSLWLTSRSSTPWLFWLLAAGLVQLRLLCNLIDGMVAIESGKGSPLGELYNEIPDRLSDAATLVGLGFAAGSVPWLGFLAAILAVFVAYVRAAVKIAGGAAGLLGPHGQASSHVRRDRDRPCLCGRADVLAESLARSRLGLPRDRAWDDHHRLHRHGNPAPDTTSSTTTCWSSSMRATAPTIPESSG